MNTLQPGPVTPPCGSRQELDFPSRRIRPAGIPLLLFAFSALTLTADPTPPRLSVHLREVIRASLPAYQQNSPLPTSLVPATAPTAPAETEPDVFVLPVLTVRERLPSSINPDDLLSGRARNRRLARDYRNSLEGLDSVLNGFSIPLFSPPMAARQEAVLKGREMEQLDYFISATRLVDPQSARELSRAVQVMRQADEWQNRPAGGR